MSYNCTTLLHFCCLKLQPFTTREKKVKETIKTGIISINNTFDHITCIISYYHKTVWLLYWNVFRCIFNLLFSAVHYTTFPTFQRVVFLKWQLSVQKNFSQAVSIFFFFFFTKKYSEHFLFIVSFFFNNNEQTINSYVILKF